MRISTSYPRIAASPKFDRSGAGGAIIPGLDVGFVASLLDPDVEVGSAGWRTKSSVDCAQNDHSTQVRISLTNKELAGLRLRSHSLSDVFKDYQSFVVRPIVPT